jgi:hypothetical protein
MSKKGFMIDLRDQHVRAISLTQTKASLQGECRNRGMRANNGETKDVICAQLHVLAADVRDLDLDMTRVTFPSLRRGRDYRVAECITTIQGEVKVA